MSRGEGCLQHSETAYGVGSPATYVRTRDNIFVMLGFVAGVQPKRGSPVFSVWQNQIKRYNKMLKIRSDVISRLLRAAMKSSCRFKVAAAGLDERGNLLAIAVNRPRLQSRGYHAEDVLLFSKGLNRHRRSLHTLVLVRLGARGDQLPIDPCPHCEKLLNDRGIRVLRA